jgi:hypothetical protein
VLADDPVFVWPLDENSGGTASDASPGGLDGRYVKVAHDDESPFGDAAATFDATSYVRGPPVDLASGQFTIELWAKRTEEGGDEVLFSQGFAKPGQGLHFAFSTNDQVDCDFYGDSLTTGRTFPDTDWHLWVCTYDPSTSLRRIYRDGDPVTNAAPSKSRYTGSGDIRLGKPRWSDKGFVGAMAHVAVYRHVLTEEQIRAHFEAAQS